MSGFGEFAEMIQAMCKTNPGTKKQMYPAKTARNHPTPDPTSPRYICPAPGRNIDNKTATPGLHERMFRNCSSKYSPQCLHFLASCAITSAQYGHVLVPLDSAGRFCGGLGVGNTTSEPQRGHCAALPPTPDTKSPQHQHLTCGIPSLSQAENESQAGVR